MSDCHANLRVLITARDNVFSTNRVAHEGFTKRKDINKLGSSN